MLRKIFHLLATGAPAEQAQVPTAPLWVQAEKEEYLCGEDGEPLRLYHASSSAVGSFWPLSHFGTVAAADHCTRSRNSVSDPGGMAMYPVYLKINNPIRIEDSGNHSRRYYEEAMRPYLTPEEHDHVFRDTQGLSDEFFTVIIPNGPDYFPRSLPPEAIERYKEQFLEYCARYREKIAELAGADFFEESGHNPRNIWAQRLCQTLLEKGYDGFVYANAEEDAGKDSYVILHPAQVTSALTPPGSEAKNDHCMTGAPGESPSAYAEYKRSCLPVCGNFAQQERILTFFR